MLSTLRRIWERGTTVHVGVPGFVVLVLLAITCVCSVLSVVFQSWNYEFSVLTAGVWVFGGVLGAALVVFTVEINGRETQTIVDSVEPDREYPDDVPVLWMGPARQDLPRFPYRRLPGVTARTCFFLLRDFCVFLDRVVSNFEARRRRLKQEPDDKS